MQINLGRNCIKHAYRNIEVVMEAKASMEDLFMFQSICMRTCGYYR